MSRSNTGHYCVLQQAIAVKGEMPTIPYCVNIRRKKTEKINRTQHHSYIDRMENALSDWHRFVMLLTDADFAAVAIVVALFLSISTYDLVPFSCCCHYRFQQRAFSAVWYARTNVYACVHACTSACVWLGSARLYIHAYISMPYIGYVHFVWMRVRACIRTVYISVNVLCTPCIWSEYAHFVAEKKGKRRNERQRLLFNRAFIIAVAVAVVVHQIGVRSVFEQRKQARHGKARQIRRT